MAVTAYGLYQGMILPLTFEVYKPCERLKPNEEYRSKPQLAAGMIRQLQALGFRFELVLADSLYGEATINFVNVLDELKLPYILAIRSNRGLWLPQDQEVSTGPWQTFVRTFSKGVTEIRYMQEVIYGAATPETVLATGSSILYSASLVESSKWLEKFAQQFTAGDSTCYLFQLAKTVVNCFPYCFIEVRI